LETGSLTGRLSKSLPPSSLHRLQQCLNAGLRNAELSGLTGRLLGVRRIDAELLQLLARLLQAHSPLVELLLHSFRNVSLLLGRRRANGQSKTPHHP
jgi:hypothetical protein